MSRCIGTPLLDDHVTPNFDYIRSSLESIRDVYNGDSLIIPPDINRPLDEDTVLVMLGNYKTINKLKKQ